MIIETRKNTPPKPSSGAKPSDHVWVACPNGHGDVTHQHIDYCGCCPVCGEVMSERKARDYLDSLISKTNERLAYNAAYQRDLRTIKRQGLNMTVAQYRESKYNENKD